MARQRFRDKLETWIVVTVITALVWLYAEGAIVQTYPRQRVPIEFVPSGDVSMVIEPAQSRVYVSFRGSSGQLQHFKTLLNRGPVRIPLTPTDTPVQEVDITEALDQLLFNDLGIALEEVDPETEPVTVRRLVKRTIPVDVIRGGLLLKAEPTLDPSQVTVTLPEDQAPLATRALVRLDQAVNANNLPTDVQQVLALDIELPPEVRGRWTQMDAQQAEVSFTLVKGDDALVLPAVPLRWTIGPGFEYEVVPEGDEKIIRDVKLTGPSETLARIAAGEPGYEVWAELHFFNATLLTPGPRTVDVFLRTPGGVTATGLRQITVNLVPKTPAPTTPNPAPAPAAAN